jgi:hypothetical protein
LNVSMYCMNYKLLSVTVNTTDFVTLYSYGAYGIFY